MKALRSLVAKKTFATLALVSLVATLSPLPAVAQAATPVVNTTITVFKTGGGDFDGVTWNTPQVTLPDGMPVDDGNDGVTNDNAGQDANDTNDIVRLNDTITYRVEVSNNDSNVENTVVTVTLDDGLDVKQEWVNLPTDCKVDPAVVNPISELQDLNGDGGYETLLCNLGFSTEGTNRTFFPSAKALVNTSLTNSPVVNDEIITASVEAYSVSNANGTSDVATDGPVYVIVTADFRLDLVKEVSRKSYLPNGDPIYPLPEKVRNAAGTDWGYIVKFDVYAQYQVGSMIADDTNGNGTSNYDLYDIYTDDNNLNNGTISNAGELYTWGSEPACGFNGDNGATANVICNQLAAADHTSPVYTVIKLQTTTALVNQVDIMLALMVLANLAAIITIHNI